MRTLTADRVVTMSIIEVELDGITRGIAAQLQRLGGSSGMTITGDVAAGILLASGDIVACRVGNMAHRIPLRDAAQAILQAFQDDLAAEDAIIVNDPYSGGSSLSCMTLLAPVMVEGRLELAVAVRGRHADVGGAGPAGTYLQATEVFQEGDRIPPLRLVRKGQVLQDRWIRLLKNNRLPQLFDVDLSALLQAARWGAAQIATLIEKYGREKTIVAVTDILERGEKEFLTLLTEWPQGIQQEQTQWVISDTEQLTIKVAVESRTDSLTFDFTGSSGQVKAPFNSPLANTWSQVLEVLRPHIPPSVWQNDGFLRTIKVAAPQGSVTNASYPAPTGFCELHPSQEIQVVIAQALAKLLGQWTSLEIPSLWGLIGPLHSADKAVSGITPITNVPYRTLYDGISWLYLTGWVEGWPSNEEVELNYQVRVQAREMMNRSDGALGQSLDVEWEILAQEMPITIITSGGSYIEWYQKVGAPSPKAQITTTTRQATASLALNQGNRCRITIGSDAEV